MLKHLTYIGAGLALMAIALVVLGIVPLCIYILSVTGSHAVWGAVMLLGAAWVIGWTFV